MLTCRRKIGIPISTTTSNYSMCTGDPAQVSTPKRGRRARKGCDRVQCPKRNPVSPMGPTPT
jgi:hypothetical protein